MISLFKYDNYRTYLRDFYTEQKTLKRNFSYKKFSDDAGIAAPSFLFHVIEGKRNLTKTTALKVSQAVGHKRDEAEYFECLVFFNQATTITEKAHYYSRLVEIRKPIDIEIIRKDRYEYYSEWYHSVVREVVAFFDFNDDFNRLGSFLVPRISGADAKKSVKLLEGLGFIKKGPSGRYSQTKNVVFAKAGPADSFILEKFQLEMLRMSTNSYNNIPVGDRMSTATTFSISQETFKLFKMRIREMQDQLMEMARIDEGPSRAYQLNLNLFPVSKETEAVHAAP